ncbi:hypothetical protein BJX70DRAFT_395333 [Aspergillus crustosus]
MPVADENYSLHRYFTELTSELFGYRFATRSRTPDDSSQASSAVEVFDPSEFSLPASSRAPSIFSLTDLEEEKLHPEEFELPYTAFSSPFTSRAPSEVGSCDPAEFELPVSMPSSRSGSRPPSEEGDTNKEPLTVFDLSGPPEEEDHEPPVAGSVSRKEKWRPGWLDNPTEPLPHIHAVNFTPGPRQPDPEEADTPDSRCSSWAQSVADATEAKLPVDNSGDGMNAEDTEPEIAPEEITPEAISPEEISARLASMTLLGSEDPHRARSVVSMTPADAPYAFSYTSKPASASDSRRNSASSYDSDDEVPLPIRGEGGSPYMPPRRRSDMPDEPQAEAPEMLTHTAFRKDFLSAEGTQRRRQSSSAISPKGGARSESLSGSRSASRRGSASQQSNDRMAESRRGSRATDERQSRLETLYESSDEEMDGPRRRTKLEPAREPQSDSENGDHPRRISRNEFRSAPRGSSRSHYTSEHRDQSKDDGHRTSRTHHRGETSGKYRRGSMEGWPTDPVKYSKRAPEDIPRSEPRTQPKEERSKETHKEAHSCTTKDTMCDKCLKTRRKISSGVAGHLLNYKPGTQPVLISCTFVGTMDDAFDYTKKFTQKLQSLFNGNVQVHAAARRARGRHSSGNWYDVGSLKPCKPHYTGAPKELLGHLFDWSWVKKNKDPRRKEFKNKERERELEFLVDIPFVCKPDGEMRWVFERTLPKDLDLELIIYPQSHHALHRQKWWRRTHPIEPRRARSGHRCRPRR